MCFSATGNWIVGFSQLRRPAIRKSKNFYNILMYQRYLSIRTVLDLGSSQTFTSFHGFVMTPEGPKAESPRFHCVDVEPLGERHTPIARGGGNGEASMNHSIYSADRMTHLKIVVVALIAGIVVAGFGISARSTDDSYTQTARVLKAGKAVAVTSSDTSLVR
jgi:hypothetical protein